MPARDQEKNLNLSAGLLSVGVALLLVILKVWALWQTGALSIAATLADSAMDLLMSLGGLAAIAYAARPADEDHAFGHTSAEDLAALAQSMVIAFSAAVIAVTAMHRLLAETPARIESEGLGLVVMAVSIVVTIGLVLWQRHVARRTGSKVVAADSLHYVGDLIPNLGAMLALALSALWGLTRVDAIIALMAAAIMLVGARGIGKAAWDALMDRRADAEVIRGIEAIAGNFPGVMGFHDLKTRTAGSRIFVNLHVELDGAQTLEEAHSIGAALRRAIIAAYPMADVLIHKDPVGVQRHPDDPRLRDAGL